MLTASEMNSTIKLHLAVLYLVAGALARCATAATSAPVLEFTSIPPFGTTSNLFGRALNVSPASFRVAVYLYVGGWYNKPTSTSPFTSIKADGTWTCDITTGGNDTQATRIAAFLMA